MEKTILYSNYNLEESYYDDTKEFLIEEGIEPTEDNIWSHIYNQDYLDREEAFEMLKNLFGRDDVIFFGTIGCWDGNYKGAKLGQFDALFNNLIKDCGFIEISDEDGKLFVKCSHHDGTNMVEIRKVTEEGLEFYDNWNFGPDSDTRTEYDVLSTIIDNYSHIPYATY